jgi:hypothetical protein
MKVNDFEKAIDALGVQGLEITQMTMSATRGDNVNSVYGRIGVLTFLWWDANGRGFRFDINPNLEGCTEVSHPEYLDYRRAEEFDLKFE